MKTIKVYCDVCKKEFEERFSHQLMWEGYWGPAWCHIIKPLEHCCPDCENKILAARQFLKYLIQLSQIISNCISVLFPKISTRAGSKSAISCAPFADGLVQIQFHRAFRPLIDHFGCAPSWINWYHLLIRCYQVLFLSGHHRAQKKYREKQREISHMHFSFGSYEVLVI